MTTTRFPRCATEPQKSGIVRAASETILINAETHDNCWNILLASEEFRSKVEFIAANMEPTESVNDKSMRDVAFMAIQFNDLLKTIEGAVLKSVEGEK